MKTLSIGFQLAYFVDTFLDFLEDFFVFDLFCLAFGADFFFDFFLGCTLLAGARFNFNFIGALDSIT